MSRSALISQSLSFAKPGGINTPFLDGARNRLLTVVEPVPVNRSAIAPKQIGRAGLGFFAGEYVSEYFSHYDCGRFWQISRMALGVLEKHIGQFRKTDVVLIRRAN